MTQPTAEAADDSVTTGTPDENHTSSPHLNSARQFWRAHAMWPAACFALGLSLIAAFDVDRAFSHALFFDSVSHEWVGRTDKMWWVGAVIHTGGRWLVLVIGCVSFVAWLASFVNRRIRPWRREAGFAFIAVALATACVCALKSVTNVDCPSDLAEFGGDRPYIELFADRPDSLPRARCFPGAHASSGFALMCAYFLLRDRSRRRARWALTGAIISGLVFSIGQEARGAHFISHDLTSAAIVWFLQLGLYVWILAPRDGNRALMRLVWQARQAP